MAFKDHFSGHAGDYARHRPTYPAELFTWLAGLAAHRDLVWDCGTGNGQAARGLAEHFAHVTATDASAQQIAAAAPDPRITFRVAPAEASGLADGSVDLVTAGQALHWFDLEAFYAEVRRVLRPGGALVAWAYTLTRVAPEIDAAVLRFYEDVVGPYWPFERRHVENGYRTLPFPFAELAGAPDLCVSADWDRAAFCAYLRTWSAVKRFEEARGFDPVTALDDELAAAWGGAAQVRRIEWPIAIRAGRVIPS